MKNPPEIDNFVDGVLAQTHPETARRLLQEYVQDWITDVYQRRAVYEQAVQEALPTLSTRQRDKLLNVWAALNAAFEAYDAGEEELWNAANERYIAVSRVDAGVYGYLQALLSPYESDWTDDEVYQLGVVGGLQDERNRRQALS